MNPKALLAVLLPLSCAAGAIDARAQDDRDYMRVIGRPEVLAYPVAVSRELSASARRKYPQIEKSCEKGVKATFCATLRDSPDVVIGPFLPKDDPGRLCGPDEPLLALPFGRQVFVLYTAPGAPTYNLTLEQLYRAIARELPPKGSKNAAESGFEPNPNKTWRDISPDLPNIPIHILAPPRRALQWLTLEDLLLRPACFAMPAVKALADIDDSLAEQHCLSRRTDRAIEYADGEKYNANPALIPQGNDLALNERRAMLLMPGAVPQPIEDVVPTPESLDAGTYRLARPILAVVKRKRLDSIPNLRTFIIELMSPAASGPSGYLRRYGMDTLPEGLLGLSYLKAQFATSDPPKRPDPASKDAAAQPSAEKAAN